MGLKLIRWGYALWIAIIYGATYLFSLHPIGGWSLFGLHMFEFGLLAYLLVSSYELFRRWCCLAGFVALVVAILDEVIRAQLAGPQKSASCLLFDCIGIVIGIAIFARCEILKTTINGEGRTK